MLNWARSKTVCRAVPVLNMLWKTGAYRFWRNVFKVLFRSPWTSLPRFLSHYGNPLVSICCIPVTLKIPLLLLIGGDELGQPPSLTDWFSSITFVKLGTCGLTCCPFHVSLGSSLKHCQKPTAQVTVSSTLPLQEGAQYSFVVHIKHKIA